MIGSEPLLRFCERTLDGYLRALDRFDDATVNVGPGRPGTNSAFVLVTHAMAAAAFWSDHVVLGNPSGRNRDAEFTATGTVDELRSLIGQTRVLLRRAVPLMADVDQPAHQPKTQTPLGSPWTVGDAAIHLYEELAQHLGHLEVTADTVVA